MTWKKLAGILCISVGASGCATNAHRESVGSLSTRTDLWSKTTAPRQVQVSKPTNQEDSVASNPPRSEKPSLSRFFPGLGRSVPNVSPNTAMLAAAKPAGKASEATVVAGSPRTSWFSFRKQRPAQTYLTDARSSASKTSVQPALLPVALQLPVRMADKAVTPTSVEVADPAASDSTVAQGSNPVTRNLDSSAAQAEPLSTTEPRLAVAPFAPKDSKSESGATLESEPAAINPEPSDQPANPAPDTDAIDPRERPRMPSTSTALTPDVVEEKPAESVASKPTDPTSNQPATDVKTVKATPSAADPSNSLGLPQATVPTSYIRHESVAVRGSGQTPSQPPPVLASPQVEASPQSPVVSATKVKKTWRRPCLRRLVRRVWKLGEFANPPTAQPH